MRVLTEVELVRNATRVDVLIFIVRLMELVKVLLVRLRVVVVNESELIKGGEGHDEVGY